MIEVPIRENGGQPKWISLSEFKKILRSTKSNSPCPPKLKKVYGFERWWKLYDYTKNKSKAEISWNRHVKKELVEQILIHTKKYVEEPVGVAIKLTMFGWDRHDKNLASMARSIAPSTLLAVDK